jgi:hypothetical protein
MPTTTLKRIVLLANKTFEADGLTAALNNREMRPASLGPPAAPAVRTDMPKGCRGVYESPEGPAVRARFEIWCLEDSMVLGDATLSSAARSQSINKLPFIGPIINGANVVIAFGTAGYPAETSINGSVVVGSATLNHSPSFIRVKPEFLRPMRNDEILTSPKGADFMRAVSAGSTLDVERLKAMPLDQVVKDLSAWIGGTPEGKDVLSRWKKSGICSDLNRRAELEAKMLKPPMNPADRPVLLWTANSLAVSSINVPSYDDFNRADEESVVKAQEVTGKISVNYPENPKNPQLASPGSYPVSSIETTHGLIRVSAPEDAAFIFISGITDRLGYFAMEVTPRKEDQNFVAAFNAGIIVGHIVDRVIANPAISIP